MSVMLPHSMSVMLPHPDTAILVSGFGSCIPLNECAWCFMWLLMSIHHDLVSIVSGLYRRIDMMSTHQDLASVHCWHHTSRSSICLTLSTHQDLSVLNSFDWYLNEFSAWYFHFLDDWWSRSQDRHNIAVMFFCCVLEQITLLIALLASLLRPRRVYSVCCRIWFADLDHCLQATLLLRLGNRLCCLPSDICRLWRPLSYATLLPLMATASSLRLHTAFAMLLLQLYFCSALLFSCHERRTDSFNRCLVHQLLSTIMCNA